MPGIDQGVPSNNHAENQNSLKIGRFLFGDIKFTCKRIFQSEEHAGESLRCSFILYGRGLKPADPSVRRTSDIGGAGCHISGLRANAPLVRAVN